ncbi:complement regulator-acquiring protein (plasmid) [Borrelia parkeri]|uniref:complement regulator-acquiring protein n=1 Tax=Borrelia parkeri TaxID=141 RepID=UPI001FF6AD03|nr:complement regulator-acquiring protein [Borrelia parkeri]UPA11219.1 complement regulator-acquiring protein [Borrelia parkeri]
MRNNILNNTFITFALIALILVGCNPNGTLAKIKYHTNSKANTNQSDDTKKSMNITFSPQIPNSNAQLAAKKGDDKPSELNPNKEHAQDNLKEAQDLELKEDKEQKHAQKNPKEDKDVKSKEDNEKAALIAEIIQKVQTNIALINGYKNNIEDDEQYGMKWGVFRFLKDNKNKKTLNSPENIHIRKQFYSSLEWKKDTLEKFGTILNNIEKHNTTSAKTILLTGVETLQTIFEETIININDKKENLNKLILQELKDIKNKLVKIEELRKKWRDTIDNIIAEYEADNDMQNNNQKLIQHVNSKYGTIFNTEIPNIQALAQDIAKILK